MFERENFNVISPQISLVINSLREELCYDEYPSYITHRILHEHRYIPLVAKQLGVKFFDQKLGSLCIEWLEDPVFAIRSAATENLSRIAKLFGPQWTSSRIVPSILKLRDSKSYLLRVTLLKAISVLAQDVDNDTKRGKLLPAVLALASDRVANVRFNAANALRSLGESGLASEIVASKIVPCLKNMQDKDSDRDVKYLSKQCLVRGGR